MLKYSFFKRILSHSIWDCVFVNEFGTLCYNFLLLYFVYLIFFSLKESEDFQTVCGVWNMFNSLCCLFIELLKWCWIKGRFEYIYFGSYCSHMNNRLLYSISPMTHYVLLYVDYFFFLFEALIRENCQISSRIWGWSVM